MTKLNIKVVPGSSVDQVAGWLGDELKVRVSAPPENGKANQAIIALLAKTLGIPKRDLTITNGATSPHKTVEIQNLSEAELMLRIHQLKH